MRSIRITLAAVLSLGMLLCCPGCVLEEKTIEVVVTGESCAEFPEDHETQQYTTPVLIDYASKISEILSENDLDRSDIVMAKVVEASYRVTDFDHSHDWVISGYIGVERIGGSPEGVILYYTDQSLEDARPEPVRATLDPAGVGILNQAFEDYLDGDSPVLRFSAHNGSVEPAPSELDPIVFTWEACIKIHIVYREELDVPDPL